MPRGMVGTVASQSSFRSFLNIQSEPWLIPLTGSSRPPCTYQPTSPFTTSPEAPLTCLPPLLGHFHSGLWSRHFPMRAFSPLSLWRLETRALQRHCLACTFQATSLLDARTGFFGCLLAHSVSPELESHRGTAPQTTSPSSSKASNAGSPTTCHRELLTGLWCALWGSSNSGHSLVHPTEECREKHWSH